MKKCRIVLLIAVIALLQSVTYTHEEKTAIFVVGMHRSGTSAMTGVLSLLGIYLGENIDGATAYNSKGHFEHHETKRINRLLLDRLHSSWHDINPLSIDWESPLVQGYKQQIKKAWEVDCIQKPVFAVKDPCMCLLLPLYFEIAREFGYSVKCIVMRRNPKEVALSLEKRNKIPLHRGMLLTQKYTKSFDNYIDQAPVPVLYINFTDLLTKTQQVLDRLKNFLPMLSITYESKLEVQQFLDINLKHFRVKK